jgi:hypothetical protein
MSDVQSCGKDGCIGTGQGGAQGTEIIPDTVSGSGGPTTQCSVSQPLPAGLVLDPQTCAVTGTPTAVQLGHCIS